MRALGVRTATIPVAAVWWRTSSREDSLDIEEDAERRTGHSDRRSFDPFGE
ncbi:MAG TPA: hypothetical protein VFN02_04075 [Ktedonobacteraceae bacterium]|nr:hypothetical protein [Ktedonobacteraceae bacterium]